MTPPNFSTPPNPHEAHVLDVLHQYEPKDAFRQLIAENDALIRASDLENGEHITAARTAIFTTLIATWAREQQVKHGYDRPFAVAALGGTGRKEVTPRSDLDMAFLVDDDCVEENQFIKELHWQTRHTAEFSDRFGFRFEAQAYGPKDAAGLKEKQLNAFLDLMPVLDPHGLCAVFRQKIQAQHDAFEHFLHVRKFWHEQWANAGAQAEGIDCFDLKNNGLRLFLGGIWTLAGKGFQHSHDIYQTLTDPRDLEAYYFLLRIRSWIHLRRPPGGVPTALGNHPEDVMTFDDFLSFGDFLGPEADERQRFEFANELRSRLLSARRRIAAFARGVIEGELRSGRRITPAHPVALGAGGLYHVESDTCSTNAERSRAALSLLRMAQRYELPIDPAELLTTFAHAGDWLEPVPELGALFAEPRGSLAGSFAFLSQIPGAEERLFPGYARFESSIDERVLTEKTTLRGPLERAKMRALEKLRREGERLRDEAVEPDELTDVGYAISIPVETVLVSDAHLVAIKLALKTKRLPLTPDDLAAQQDATRPLYDRYSTGFSGIPLDEYYSRCFATAGFADGALEVAHFLVANRRAFKELADDDLMDDLQVSRILEICGGDLSMLRTLFVFTCADRAEWDSPSHDPTRWFNILELYAKARMPEDKRFDPEGSLAKAGYDAEEMTLLADFGQDFFEGRYRHFAIRLGPHLLRLKQGGRGARPRVTPIYVGASLILGVTARDDRGIAASISGALWKQGVELRQAHLFSAMNQGLVLDFFHLSPQPSESAEAGRDLPKLCRIVEDAIQQRLHISEADEAALPDVARNFTLGEWRSGLLCLRAETFGEVGALIYVLTCRAFRSLGADIHGLAAHTGRRHAWVSVYLKLPETLTLDEARHIVGQWG